MLVAAVLTVNAVSAATPADIIVNYHEALQNLAMPAAMSAGNQKVALVAPQAMSFAALGRQFELTLEANRRLTSAASHLVMDDIGVYRGELVGVAGSWTRIVVADGLPRGLIWNGQELFAIEAPGDSQVASNGAVIYRLADSMVVPNSMSCAADDIAQGGAQAVSTLIAELKTALATGATSEINVGMVGDFEFSQAFGANATAAIMTRLNNVDGIFSEQLGVQINVPTIDIFTTSGDPFTDETDAGMLLDEVSTYRLATPAQNAAGLTHMYTGRDLDGTTVGIAYLAALCNSRFGVGLSEARRGATTDSLIAAHEIGHNFGAPHDGESGSACESTLGLWLMSPSINGIDRFSQCSIDEVQPTIAAATGRCLFPIANADVALSVDPTSLSAPLGSSFSLTFNIDNGSGDSADNVMFNTQIGTEFSLQTATPSAGSCTSGAGNVDCQLGSIPAGASRNVVLDLTADAVGTTNQTGTITADQDSNASNDQASAQVSVTPVVDMTVTAATSAQVTMNQSAALQIPVENLSSISATNVAVAIALDAGLRADSASWSAGSCNVANQQVDCQGANLQGQTTSSIQLSVTGLTQGQQSYSVSVSADEPDPSTANNSAMGTVTVNAPAADDSGGGGPVNPGLLLALFGLAACRRRGSAHQCNGPAQ